MIPTCSEIWWATELLPKEFSQRKLKFGTGAPPPVRGRVHGGGRDSPRAYWAGRGLLPSVLQQVLGILRGRSPWISSPQPSLQGGPPQRQAAREVLSEPWLRPARGLPGYDRSRQWMSGSHRRHPRGRCWSPGQGWEALGVPHPAPSLWGSRGVPHPAPPWRLPGEGPQGGGPHPDQPLGGIPTSGSPEPD